MAKKRSKRTGGRPGGGRDPRAVFIDRVANIFDVPPAEAEALASTPLKQSIRVNTLSTRPRADIEADLAALGVERAPIAWAPDCFHLHSPKALVSESALFANGDVYIQNAASFIPPLALDARPGQRILDLCAAPGGKSAHIAAITNNTARLWLNDGIPARIAKLEEVIGLLGVNAETITTHPAQYADKFIEAAFDRILIDAQCTGEGMVDLSRAGALRYWSLERIRKYSRLQQRMLMSAWKLLKPGGLLVYSTCTFAPEENEAPVSHLVKHRDDADLEPIPLDVPGETPGRTNWEGANYEPALTHAMRIRPSEFLEGFFTARIRKAAD
ncbi:RsmB/NOP family class I SAM-dependent RNA methyltransferase [Marinicauda salina]|nr:RsmB/NOP family class I SAM-dependent RNA methyltransferase [Marinicauda salina]